MASDDFVFPSIAEDLIQFSWLVTFAATFYAIKDNVSCDKDGHIKQFWYGTFGLDTADFFVTLAVLTISMRGTITNSRPRRHVTWVLAIKLLIWLGAVVWTCLSTNWIFLHVTSCGPTLTWVVKGALLWSWLLRLVKVVGAVTFMAPWTSTLTQVSTSPVDLNAGSLKLASYGHQAVNQWERRVRRLFCCVPDTRDSHDAFRDVGKIAAEYFNLDVVQSDVVAGMMLVLRQQLEEEAVASEGDVLDLLYSRPSISITEDRDAEPVPEWMNIPNMAYFIRYAIACYGSLVYVARNPCTGLCRLCCSGRCCCGRGPDAENVIDDDRCHTNLEAVKNWTNLKEEDIIYFSMSNKYKETPFFVAVDRRKQVVVIALRGTWSAEDTLADLAGQGTRMTVEDVKDAYCHHAQLERAQQVLAKLNNMEILQTAFHRLGGRDHENRLVITGHSLGSGVASILSVLLKPQYPGVKCYAFSPMGCSVSPDLSRYTEQFICSPTLGADMIARTDMLTLTDLKVKMLKALIASDRPKYQILARGFLRFLYCCCILGDEPDSEQKALLKSFRARKHRRGDVENPQVTVLEEALDQAEADLHSVRSNNWPLKLPGRLLHIVEADQSEDRCCSDKPAFHAYWVQNSTFENILLTSTMLTDHLPGNVLHALDDLVRHQASPLS